MSLLVILALAQAVAAKVERPPECGSSGVQRELNLCAEQEFLAADAQLNAQWSLTAAAMRRADRASEPHTDGRPGYFDQLLAGQRAWLAFRDAHCTSEGYHARGGSMQPMLVSGCKETLTRERTAQLRALANYPD